MAMATGLWLLAIGMFIASNPAVQMLKLSQHFAAAPVDEQRSQAVAAGEPVLANWEELALPGKLRGWPALRDPHRDHYAAD